MRLPINENQQVASLQDFIYDSKIVHLHEIEGLKNSNFKVHISTKNLLPHIKIENFIQVLVQIKNVYLSVEGDGFPFKICELEECVSGNIVIERLNTSGICLCDLQTNECKSKFIKMVEKVKSETIILGHSPSCCDGMLKFETMDVEILSKWPIESIYTGIIDFPVPFVLNPPMQTIIKFLNIPSLKKVYTKHEYKFFQRLCAMKNIIVVAKCC